MIWLFSTILAGALVVFYVMACLANMEAWPFGWLFRRLDTFHSELKAEERVRKARRELARRRDRGDG